MGEKFANLITYVKFTITCTDMEIRCLLIVRRSFKSGVNRQKREGSAEMKSSTKFLCVIAIPAALAVSTAAQADGHMSKKGFYVGAAGVASFVDDFDFTNGRSGSNVGHTIEWDTGWGGVLRGGYNYGSTAIGNVRAELELGARRVDIDNIFDQPNPSGDTMLYSGMTMAPGISTRVLNSHLICCSALDLRRRMVISLTTKTTRRMDRQKKKRISRVSSPLASWAPGLPMRSMNRLTRLRDIPLGQLRWMNRAPAKHCWSTAFCLA